MIFRFANQKSNTHYTLTFSLQRLYIEILGNKIIALNNSLG
jgi:hypothetical protein